MPLPTLSDSTFDAQVLSSQEPVLVKFEASWCAPCKALSPVLEELATQHPGVKIMALNIENSPRVAQRYSVRALPTLILFKAGRPLAQKMGLTRKADIAALLTSA